MSAPPTYSAAGLPNGLSINSSTAVISGTLRDGGTGQPALTATNGAYSDTKSFNCFGCAHRRSWSR